MAVPGGIGMLMANYVDIGDLGYIENYRQALDVEKCE